MSAMSPIASQSSLESPKSIEGEESSLESPKSSESEESHWQSDNELETDVRLDDEEEEEQGNEDDDDDNLIDIHGDSVEDDVLVMGQHIVLMKQTLIKLRNARNECIFKADGELNMPRERINSYFTNEAGDNQCFSVLDYSEVLLDLNVSHSWPGTIAV